MSEYYLGIDPGSSKTGLAVMDNSGEIAFLQVVQTVKLAENLLACRERWQPLEAVIGNGTNSGRVSDVVRKVLPDLPLKVIEEAHSTEDARKLYWQINPPQGWRKIVPLGLLVPVEPLDAYAAAVLLKRFLNR